MLKDCLQIFQDIYFEKGDRYVTDNFHLSEGSYVLVDEEGEIEKILEVGKRNLDTNDDYYFYFAQRNYLSQLIGGLQKPIDSSKKIHSNNYLSFFIKKQNINRNILTSKIVDTYYNMLLNPLEKYKKDKKKMYQQVEDKYGKADAAAIEKYKNWIKENIYTILDHVKNDKSYLKIFFKECIEDYIKESEKYVIPNIFNNTDYNKEINEVTFGLPNDNMGLNFKKPYLENKTRKNTLPYLISTEEVMIQKKFFDYLMNYVSEGKNNIYLRKGKITCLSNEEAVEDGFAGYFLRIKKGKEVEIHDFDVITGIKENIRGLTVDETIPIQYGKGREILDYIGEVETISKLKGLINVIYFNKFLTSNYFTDAKDIKLSDFRVKENLLKSRTAFFNWFYKGDSRVVKQIINKISMDLIKNSICNDYILKAKEQFNLRYGLLRYFGGVENMADILSGIVNNLRRKVNSSRTDKVDTDLEYYFAVGQITSYLISLNKSSKKMHSLINPIINCKTDEGLKSEISKLFKKYNYVIRKENKKFNNLKAMILGYEAEGKIKEDILVAGYLYNNLIYESNRGEEIKNA